MKLLITGGCGFIGSHVVRKFVLKYPNYNIYNIDSLTYAGNSESLNDIENYPNYNFIKCDIRDREYLFQIFKKNKFENVIHLAAESHVDKSILNPLSFVNTNVIGTLNLLDAFKLNFKSGDSKGVFYHISTDEVYGSLGPSGVFTETSLYNPSSPYSASKASADHFVRSYGKTFRIPYLISHCSNNYGPNQFPEKLIPVLINNIIKNRPLPIYGNGLNRRDWIYVDDHVNAIDNLLHKGKINNSYNIGDLNEYSNLDLVKLICNLCDKKLNNPDGASLKLIKFVNDRPGHDFRYSVDSKKIQKEIKWKPLISMEDGLLKTIDWYLNNQSWVENMLNNKKY